MRWVGSAGAVAAMTLCARMATADVWDTADHTDDSQFNENALMHGSVQVHDLGFRGLGYPSDKDYSIALVPPYSSFEVQIDGMTGDLGGGALQFQRVEFDGETVLQYSTEVYALGIAQRLSWRNTTANVQVNRIRVSGPGCGTTCTADDQYTIRARETTVNLARFNNSATQTTVLLTQNASPDSINATLYFWSNAGALLAAVDVALAPKALNVLSAASIPALAGASGSVTVAHDGPYGGLNIKAVALEPATGFSFDTPGVARGY
jgi:hypothetical protein